MPSTDPGAAPTEGSLPPLRIGTHLAPVVPDVLAEHLEEMAFLSISRRTLLFSPEVSYPELLGHERRIAAHWDGLAIGGAASVGMALERLEAFDPWEIYAAVRVWLEMGAPPAEEVLNRLAEADPEHRPSWREAFRRASREGIAGMSPPPRESWESPAVQGVLAFAWGWNGTLVDAVAANLAFHSDPQVRWCIARALGWGAGPQQAERLLAALVVDPEAGVRRAALWSEALLRPQAALTRARHQFHHGQPEPTSARILGLWGGPEDISTLAEAGPAHGLGVASALALGELGDPRGIEPLVGLLEQDEEIASAAAFGIRRILGDLPGEDGIQEADQEGGSGVMDPERVRNAWSTQADHFQEAPRWLRGKPFPWNGPPGEESMESLWQASVLGWRTDFDWLRKELPDGLLDSALEAEATPGV